MDALGIFEAHLGLRGMHVHVHRASGDLEEEHRVGKASPGKHIAVDLDQGVLQQSVPHRAAIHEEIDPRGVAAVTIGPGHEATDTQRTLFVLHGYQRFGLALAQHARHPIQGFTRTRPVPRRAPVALHVEVDIRACQGCARHRIRDVTPFRLRALQELPARRHGSKQVRNLDPRARTGSDFPPFFQFTRADEDLVTRRRTPGSRDEPERGHGGDCREGLAAKAVAVDVHEVATSIQLASRVAFQRQARVRGPHPAAVIGHRDAVSPTPANFQPDPAGAGIQGVFHQFLHHRGGTFHDLPRRDTIHQSVGQALNPRGTPGCFRDHQRPPGARGTRPTAERQLKPGAFDRQGERFLDSFRLRSCLRILQPGGCDERRAWGH